MRASFFTLPDENNLSAVYQFLYEKCIVEFPLTFEAVGQIEMRGCVLFCENMSYRDISFVQGLCSAFSILNGYFE